MTTGNLIRATFPLVSDTATVSESSQREEFRKRALESISGSMVFVEDKMLYWDIADE